MLLCTRFLLEERKKANYEILTSSRLRHGRLCFKVYHACETRRRPLDQPARGAIGKRQSWRTRAAAAPAVVAPRRRSPTLHSHIVRRWDRTCVVEPVFKRLHLRRFDSELPRVRVIYTSTRITPYLRGFICKRFPH